MEKSFIFRLISSQQQYWRLPTSGVFWSGTARTYSDCLAVTIRGELAVGYGCGHSGWLVHGTEDRCPPWLLSSSKRSRSSQEIHNFLRHAFAAWDAVALGSHSTGGRLDSTPCLSATVSSGLETASDVAFPLLSIMTDMPQSTRDLL